MRPAAQLPDSRDNFESGFLAGGNLSMQTDRQPSSRFPTSCKEALEADSGADKAAAKFMAKHPPTR
jgi:hypothetical protein